MNLTDLTSKTNLEKDNVLVPVVIEKDPNGYERSYDIYSRLLKDFIVFITGEVEMGMANTFVAQLLFLESQDSSRDIMVYINSPGGSVYAGLAMLDTMRHVKNDITTINIGLAASMGAILMCGGKKGKRFALPNSYTLIHQTLGGTEGQASDIEIYAKQILKTREQLAGVLAKATGKKLDIVLKDMDRDNWMDAKAALEYGLIDEILVPQK